MLFVITGPSGCGKSVMVRCLLRELDSIEFSISHTSRKRRNSEIDGRDYYFISREKFKQMIKKKKFAEWAVVHGNYYGTTVKEIEKTGSANDLLLDIDVQGAKLIKRRFKDAQFIFILPPGFQELKRRLEERGEESLESIEKRLNVAREEIKCYDKFDYVIVNDQLNSAVQELKSIIVCRRCRLDARRKDIEPIIQSFVYEDEKSQK